MEEKKAGEDLIRFEQATEETIEMLCKCISMVHKLPTKKINQFQENLRKMDNYAQKMKTTIPFSILEGVDKDQNPYLYSKEIFDVAVNRNNETRGKLFATAVLEQHLEARYENWINKVGPLESQS